MKKYLFLILCLFSVSLYAHEERYESVCHIKKMISCEIYKINQMLYMYQDHPDRIGDYSYWKLLGMMDAYMSFLNVMEFGGGIDQDPLNLYTKDKVNWALDIIKLKDVDLNKTSSCSDEFPLLHQ